MVGFIFNKLQLRTFHIHVFYFWGTDNNPDFYQSSPYFASFSV